MMINVIHTWPTFGFNGSNDFEIQCFFFVSILDDDYGNLFVVDYVRSPQLAVNRFTCGNDNFRSCISILIT